MLTTGWPQGNSTVTATQLQAFPQNPIRKASPAADKSEHRNRRASSPGHLGTVHHAANVPEGLAADDCPAASAEVCCVQSR